MPINSKQKGNTKINSRAKGTQGEREFAKLLQKFGYFNARRGVQYSGANGDADVIGGPEGFHFEIKRVERLNIYDAVDQSKRDARDGEKPVVAHRKNRREWLITMPADVFFGIIKK